MARVLVSAQALTDAGDILRDLNMKAGLRVAADYQAAFEAILDRLAIFPEIGAPRPKLGRRIRIGLVTPYVVVYRYTPDSDLVEIVRVLHGGRRLSRDVLRAR